MKLSKEVCKKCIENHTALGWNSSDETSWKEGYIFCVKLSTFSIYIENVEIPDGCLYALEHIVTGNIRKKNNYEKDNRSCIK